MADYKKAPVKKEPAKKEAKSHVCRNGCVLEIENKNLQNFLDAGWKRFVKVKK